MKYVVIGASAAGINAVREIRRLDKKGSIVLISKDEMIYSRCILHHYLGNIRTKEELNFAEHNFEELYQVQWIKGKACVGIDSLEKKVLLEDGREVSYHKLLIATGSKTHIPDIEHFKEAKNICGFRHMGDVERLKEIVKTKKNIIVMGAGLVGMDCVVGLLEAGVKPVIVEREHWMLIRQLDERAAKTYQDAFEKRGVKQFYNADIKHTKMDENGNITKVILDNKTELECDFIVAAAGVRPNIDFLEGSEIETNHFGLIYDTNGQTSDEDVYGAGDVSGLMPIWPAAVKEGIFAASNMVGIPAEMNDFFESKSTMNYLGIPTMSLGIVNPIGHHHSTEILETKDCYKKIIHAHGKIEGAILQGDLSYCGVLQQLIALQVDISKVKKSIFEIDYSDFFNMDENFEFFFEDEWI